MQERFSGLRERWQHVGDLGLGIGLSLGEVILGHVGSGKHVDFTVVGTPVNLASRLCALASSGEILASAPFVKALDSPQGWSPLPPLTIKGFDETIQAYTSRRPEQ
jgi:adenylate cyclase